MSDWQVVSSEEVYETPWIRVRRDELRNHNGTPLTYSVVETRHPSVFIVAVNAEGNIHLQRGYRYTIDKTLWEIPAGHSDREDPLKAAQRELLEETGLTSNDWTRLGRLYQAVGIGNIPLEAFLARGVSSISSIHDKDEQITERQFMSLQEIEAMVRRGEFEDAPVLAVLYLAKVHGL